MAGSLLGAIILTMIFPCEMDMTTNLGSNVINPAYGGMSAFIGEIFMTFLLCYTVWETAVTARCGQAACIPIGPPTLARSTTFSRISSLFENYALERKRGEREQEKACRFQYPRAQDRSPLHG